MNKSTSLIFTIFISLTINAQRTITGIVTDKENEKLPGVSIIAKGTTIGTMSMSDGTYVIEVFESVKVLVFSYPGFEDKEVKIASVSNVIDVKMDTYDMIDVCICMVTYGIPRNEKSSAYYKRKIYGDEIYNYLQNNIKFEMYNTSQSFGNCQPLFVVDGVIYNPSNNRNLSELNPDVIDNITVLKGREATAKYGSRAANGVIVISTKHGRWDKRFELNFASNFSIDVVGKLPELQNTYAQGRSDDGSLILQGADDSEKFSWGPKISDLEYDNAGNSAKAFNPYDFLTNGFTANNTLSVNGRLKQDNKYYFSASNKTQKGIIPDSKTSINSFNLKMDNSFKKKLKTKVLINYSNLSANNANLNNSYSSIFKNLLVTSPSFNNEADKSKSYSGSLIDNPYFSVRKNLLKDKNSIFSFAFVPSYDKFLYDELKIIGFASANINNNNKYIGFNINSAYKPLGEYVEYIEKSNFYNSKLTLDYDFNDYSELTIKIDANAECNFERIKVSTNKGKGFLDEDIWSFNNTKKQCAYYNDFYKSQLSGFFNSNFGFYRSIYLTFTGRADKNYSISNQKTLYSKSAGLSFIISDIFNLQYITNYSKIYASYGTKDIEIPIYAEPYFFTKNMFNINMPFYEKRNVIANNLQPEKKKDFEFGFDLRFLRNRLKIDFSYQNSKSTNKYAPININERSITLINAGQIKTDIFEGSVNLGIINKIKLKFSTGFNFLKTKSIVSNVSENYPNGIVLMEFQNFSTRIVNNEEYGVFWGTKYLRNSNGDKIIGSDGFPIVDKEQGVIGNSNPDFIIGMSTKIEYSNFELLANFDYKKGGDIWNGTKNTLNYYGVSKETGDFRETTNYVFDGINENGDINTIAVDFYNPANDFSANRWVRYGENGVAEDAIEDGTWFRLNNVELKYKMPYKLSNKIKSNKIEFSAFAQNIFIITKYSGINPNTNFINASYGNGIDYFNLPSVKTFGLRLIIGF